MLECYKIKGFDHAYIDPKKFKDISEKELEKIQQRISKRKIKSYQKCPSPIFSIDNYALTKSSATHWASLWFLCPFDNHAYVAFVAKTDVAIWTAKRCSNFAACITGFSPTIVAQ
jgi:hypothetical protein